MGAWQPGAYIGVGQHSKDYYYIGSYDQPDPICHEGECPASHSKTCALAKELYMRARAVYPVDVMVTLAGSSSLDNPYARLAGGVPELRRAIELERLMTQNRPPLEQMKEVALKLIDLTCADITRARAWVQQHSP